MRHQRRSVQGWRPGTGRQSLSLLQLPRRRGNLCREDLPIARARVQTSAQGARTVLSSVRLRGCHDSGYRGDRGGSKETGRRGYDSQRDYAASDPASCAEARRRRGRGAEGMQRPRNNGRTRPSYSDGQPLHVLQVHVRRDGVRGACLRGSTTSGLQAYRGQNGAMLPRSLHMPV